MPAELERVVAHLSPHVEASPGPLDPESLDAPRRALLASLPEEVQALLGVWNGATFSTEPGLGYSTGIESVREGHRSTGDDLMNELFGFSAGAAEELLEYHERCQEEAFLPRGLVPIGHGIQHSLLLVSTRERDRGAVFYWEWYWQYPWYLPFFERRIDAALAQFDDAEAAGSDPEHPDHDAVVEAANGATVVQLADGLFDWLLALRPAEPLED